MTPRGSRRTGMTAFLIVWSGQLVSTIGSGMTSFALGVAVFEQTGSVTQFALITLFRYVPHIAVTMVAGVWADRYSRRAMLIGTKVAMSVVSIVLIVAVVFHALQFWLIYAATFAISVFAAAQFPPFQASIRVLVQDAHLGRANGMTQLTGSMPRLVSPFIAALLLPVVGLLGVIVTDLATFLVAIATLVVVSIPQPARTGPRRSVLREAEEGWAYIVQKPGLLSLLLFFTIANITAAFAISLLTPLVLSFTTTFALGVVSSLAGLGVLVGSVLSSVWGGPRRRILSLFVGSALYSVCVALLGVSPSVVLIAAAGFGYSFFQPFVNVASIAFWQSKVPPRLQGRVLAVVRVMALAAIPIAALAAGPLSDRVFEPLMATGGPLATSVGRVIGTGPGRGIGLLLIVAGLLPIVTGAAVYTSRAVRRAEIDIPDAPLADAEA